MNIQSIGNFSSDGYQVIRNVIGHDLLNFLKILFNMEINKANHIKKFNWNEPELDNQAPYSDYFYASLYSDSLLLYCKDIMEKVTCRKLGETYSYWRNYKYGSTLWEHVDREACQFSATLCIDSTIDWPICVIVDDEIKEISLHDGDMLIYRGMEIPHLRNTFTGKKHIQVFLHYVDLLGPYKNSFRDGRKILGIQK